MKRRIATLSLFLAGAVLLTVTSTAYALDTAEARRIADAYVSLRPGDDIEHDFRVVYIQVVDLDDDGVEEILYAETSTCNGASFDCSNGLRVLAVNKTGAMPNGYDTMDADMKRAFATGYDLKGIAFIPGDIHRVRVSGKMVVVDFEASEKSSICMRFRLTEKGRQPTSHCPPPGKYRWSFNWRPGAGLTRVDRQ